MLASHLRKNPFLDFIVVGLVFLTHRWSADHEDVGPLIRLVFAKASLMLEPAAMRFRVWSSHYRA